MKPIRIQRKRSKGWKMAPNTVYVGRPSKFGNPFVIGGNGALTAELAKEMYRHYILYCAFEWEREAIRKELRGKNLACWCKPGAPCHADVLLEIANHEN